MQILNRAETYKLWDQYWQDMEEELFKIEVMQDYTGEDDSPSLRAWLAGDKAKSLALILDTTHALIFRAASSSLLYTSNKHKA